MTISLASTATLSSYWIRCKTAHLSLRYTTTALSFLSWSRAGIALPFEYAAEGDWEPVSDTDLIWRLTSNTWRKETKFHQFNWSLRLIREHKVSWYRRSRFRKVQQGRTAFLLCLTSDWLKTKNQQTNKNQNQQIKQKHRQKKNKQRETNLNYYCNNSIRCPWGWVFIGNERKETWAWAWAWSLETQSAQTVGLPPINPVQT